MTLTEEDIKKKEYIKKHEKILLLAGTDEQIKKFKQLKTDDEKISYIKFLTGR